MLQINNSFVYKSRKYLANIYQNGALIRYLIGGGFITGINVGLYTGLVLASVPIRWANLLALIAAKTAGFFINKYYVYQTETTGWKNTGREAGKYVFARTMTGVFEYVGVVLLVEQMGFPALTTKYVITAFVIIGNYLLGKYFVFSAPNRPVSER